MLYKAKGDRRNLNNYRAIAAGSTLGKIFSQCVLDRNTEIHLPSSFYTKHTINIKRHTPHQHMHSAGQPNASAQECAKDHCHHCHHCHHLVYSCSAGTSDLGGLQPAQKYRNTEIHSMTKLFSKHTTIVLNEALTADLCPMIPHQACHWAWQACWCQAPPLLLLWCPLVTPCWAPAP